MAEMDGIESAAVKSYLHILRITPVCFIFINYNFYFLEKILLIPTIKNDATYSLDLLASTLALDLANIQMFAAISVLW